MNVVDTVKNAAFASAIQAALNYMDKDPETNIPKVMSIVDRKSTRLNSSHIEESRMPSSA